MLPAARLDRTDVPPFKFDPSQSHLLQPRSSFSRCCPYVFLSLIHAQAGGGKMKRKKKVARSLSRSASFALAFLILPSSSVQFSAFRDEQAFDLRSSSYIRGRRGRSLVLVSSWDILFSIQVLVALWLLRLWPRPTPASYSGREEKRKEESLASQTDMHSACWRW